MPNFVDDNTSLSYPKTSLREAPAGSKKHLRAADWNDLCQAAVDLREAVKDVRINVKHYGAVGDGVTDDRSAIQLAVEAAVTNNRHLYFEPGVYYISKYVPVTNASNLFIFSSAAIIRYPSSDTSIATDTVATSGEMAQSAFVLRNCSGVTIQGITFRGDNEQNLNDNVGCGIYATRCVGSTVRDCTFIDGGPFIQDATTGTTGTGDSLTVNGTTVTLVDSAGSFSTGHVRRWITISGASNPGNNGTFLVDTASSTQLTFTNPAGTVESSSFRWSIDDADRGTLIEGCRFFGVRRPLRTGHDAVVAHCHFELPMNLDTGGRGSSFSLSGTTVTFSDKSAPFKTSHVGKYITIASATSAGNNGTFLITAVTSSSVVTYENASGVTEAAASGTTWWLADGDKTGLGNGASALTKSGSTVTLTAAVNSFHSSDIGKVIRIAQATTAGNNGAFVIASVPAANQVTFTNSSGASETYTGVWTVDAYDNAKPDDTYGSTHAIYLFAGRCNVKVIGCTFRGIRTVCVKVSGSSLPIRNIQIVDNYAEECGSFAITGADDSQEHTDITIERNTLINVGTGRPGATEMLGIQVLGSRNVSVRDNKFHYTRPSVSKLDGRNTVNGHYGINAGRYVVGISQPVEDLSITNNVFTSDSDRVGAISLLSAPVYTQYIGQRAYFATAGTLTKSGTTMTLNHTDAAFSQSLVGCQITLVNSAGGNDGTFTVTSVLGTSGLTYENPAGTGGGVSAGTYRIKPKDNRAGAGLVIQGNQFYAVSGAGISTTQCTAPEIVGNTFSGGGQVECAGDVSPRIVGNREIYATTANARIRLNNGTSWPYVENNLITNGNLNTNVGGRDMGIGANSSTPVDYPLLGKRGRCKPTQSFQEIVVAYGAGHVDGDTIIVSGVTYTYKATSPTGNQFNSFAGLVALIDAQANHDAADYGAQFSPAVSTQHIRIRRTVATTTDVGQLYVQTSALNPTALVMVRNKIASNQAYCYGRGSASTSTATPDRSVVWSPATTFAGSITLVADNETARTLIANGSYRSVKNGTEDPGACELIQHDTSDGTEEFRWVIT